MYQSALGGMVIYESFQAKVCISIGGDSEWKLQCNFFICLGVENHNDDAKRVYFSSNKWNARIDCYESLLHRKGITPSTMMNTGSMEAFRL